LTVFDRGTGEALRIDYSDPSLERRSTRMMGKDWNLVMDHARLVLPPFGDLDWDAYIGFLVDEWDSPFSLLGTEGFLDHWAVSFVQYKDYFTVEPMEEWERRMGIDPFEEFQKLDDWDRPTPS
jgi:hypothetical protein